MSNKAGRALPLYLPTRVLFLAPQMVPRVLIIGYEPKFKPRQKKPNHGVGNLPCVGQPRFYPKHPIWYSQHCQE